MSVLINNKTFGEAKLMEVVASGSGSSIDVNPTVLLLQLSQVDEGYDV